jgi:hypothetical protein
MMRRGRRALLLIVSGAVATAVVWGAPSPVSAGHHGAHVVVPPGQAGPRVGPSSLYPDPTLTPGATNPNITQANINDTICCQRSPIESHSGSPM